MDETAYGIADRLEKLAAEIEHTAIGSSRLAMYQTIAREMRAEAGRVRALAHVDAVGKRL